MKSKFYERTVKRQCVYKGRIINVENLVVKMPAGNFAQREVVRHPGAVTIIGITKDKKIVLIRQFRKPVEEEIWEIPAGLVKKGESDRQGAIREFKEETGYRVRRMRQILSGYVSPGYSSELLKYFLATGLTKAEANTDEDELIDVFEIPIKQAVKWVKSGKIKDNKTIIGILLAKDINGSTR